MNSDWMFIALGHAFSLAAAFVSAHFLPRSPQETRQHIAVHVCVSTNVDARARHLRSPGMVSLFTGKSRQGCVRNMENN